MGARDISFKISICAVITKGIIFVVRHVKHAKNRCRFTVETDTHICTTVADFCNPCKKQLIFL